MEFHVRDLDSLPEAASGILNYASGTKIFLFEGEMGAGKTTLIKEICKQLGSADTVSSPTYSIVNEYPCDQGRIYHFDFFRIKDESEAFDLGFEEYLYSGEYCFIEWPEKIPNLWPSAYIEISISCGADGQRAIFVNKV